MANFVEFKAGNEEYKLRLGMSDILSLENKLGGNPMSVFGTGDTVPEFKTMIDVLHASLQKFHHGVTWEKASEILEKWIDEENCMNDFIFVIFEIYKVSGIIPRDFDIDMEKN